MIANETVRVSYAGNNSTSTPYPITFSFRTKDDIRVVVRDSAGTETTLLVDVDFTVTGAELTTSVAVVPSSSVIIYRRTPPTQSSDYVELSAFPAESHEEALDKLTLLAQEARDGLERCFRLSDSSPAVPSGGEIITDSVMGLDSFGLPLFRTPTEVMAWLSLASTVFNFPTKSWANSAERALAVPDFIGQFGMQRDTTTTYMGTALSAGSWTPTTAAGVADGAITTEKLANEVLAANGSGRAKMMDAYVTLAKLSTDTFTSAIADSLLDHADQLFGYNGTEFRKYAGNVVVPPGSVIQTKYGEYTPNNNLETMPWGDNIPQITEGSEIISLSITPRFASSQIYADFATTASSPGQNNAIAALFRAPVSSAIAATETIIHNTNYRAPLVLRYLDSPATTTSVTYKIRAGGQPNFIRLNGNSSGRLLGGAMRATLVLQEIKV